MKHFTHSLTRAFALAVLALAFQGTAQAQDQATPGGGVSVTPVVAENLTESPGKKLTAVVVDFAPGATSAPHQHAGFVFAYVLSGAVRSQLTGGSADVYEAGEHFIEPPGSEHLVAANASATEPARLLAVFIADRGAELTTRSR